MGWWKREGWAGLMSSDNAVEYLLNRTVETAVSFHVLIRTSFNIDVRMKKEWSTQYLINNITSSHLTGNHNVIHSHSFRLYIYIYGDTTLNARCIHHGKRREHNHELRVSGDFEGWDYGWKSLGGRTVKPELLKGQDIVFKIKHENDQLLGKFLDGLYSAH